MKKVKQLLLVAVAMILVSAISIAATFAYLYDDSETVRNAFAIGKIDISLDEAKVNINGQLLDVDDNVWTEESGKAKADRVLENEYKLIPGRTYVKDPIVHVSDDSEPCYVFALIFLPNNIENVIKYSSGLDDPESLEYQIFHNGWSSVGRQTVGTGKDGSEGVYKWFWYVGDGTYPVAVSKGAELPFFQSITVKESATYDQLEKANNCKMEITAYAFQVEETDTVYEEDIFDTFETVFDPYNLGASSN